MRLWSESNPNYRMLVSMKTRYELKAALAAAMVVANVGCKRNRSPGDGNLLTNTAAPTLSAPRTSSPANLLERWDSLTASGDAEKNAVEHAKILAEAETALGEGAGLGEFIEGLHDRRETANADRLLSEHKKAMFSGKNGVETREWLLGVKDGDFRKRMCFEAGYFFIGPGLKEYLESLTPPQAQERFLTGYCSRLAESDPVRTIQEYKALRSGKMTFYGLLEVMDCLAPDGDFAKADAIFPDDYDEANNMGAALRQRLLARWAAFHPEAAAQYVADTPKRVKPESVRVVIAKWSESKPEDALAWLEKAPAGPLRDAGFEELAKLALKTGSPADAWQRAAKVSDFDRKVKLATEVFKEWEKKDQAAAVKAWEELFPPAR